MSRARDDSSCAEYPSLVTRRNPRLALYFAGFSACATRFAVQ
jgi:hypothetical protein